MAPICQRGGLSAGSTTASTSTETSTKRPECPNGWEIYTADASVVKCFKYYTGAKYATSAEDYCQTHGGHLASIHSIEEQNFLKNLIGSSGVVWIGAVEPRHNGVWEWTDGSNFDFSYWVSGQPDGGQYYALIDDVSSGAWRDYEYNHSAYFMCQIIFYGITIHNE